MPSAAIVREITIIIMHHEFQGIHDSINHCRRTRFTGTTSTRLLVLTSTGTSTSTSNGTTVHVLEAWKP
jgi:hypothetical protein